MLEAVRVLGNNIQSNSNSLSSYLRDFLSIAKLRKVTIVLGIVIKDGISYDGITIENKIDDKIEKYLYSAGSANGPDKTPTSIVTVPERTFQRKILRWFDKFAVLDNELISIKDTLVRSKDTIIDDMTEHINNLKKEEKSGSSILLTIKLKKSNDEEMFIGELESVRRVLVSRYQSTENKESSENLKNINEITDSISTLSQCYFCGQNKAVIRGKSPISDIFSFSTFDKRGFLYDFNKNNMHKQIPICSTCYLDLKRGKDWLDLYTYFGFEGYKYYVIPDIMSYRNDKQQDVNQLNEFREYAQHFSKVKSSDKLKTSLRYENNLMQYEKDLLEFIVEKEIRTNLLFLFVSLKGGGKYMDIEKYIEDVPITWIAKLFDVFNSVLNSPIFDEDSMRNIFGQRWEHGRLKDRKNEMYLAAVIRLFFPKDSLDMQFLEAISHFLTGSGINSRVLFEAFMRSIRSQIYNNWTWSRMVALKSLVLLITMLRLELISDMSSKDKYDNSRRRETAVNLSSSQDSDNININNNNNSHDYEVDNTKNNNSIFEEILDSNPKKAVFFEGLLVGKLLSIQYANRKSTPFVDRLHGLHISFAAAKSLLPKVVGKLREYGAAYTDIERKTAYHFILSEKIDKALSEDVTSYYFTLGMLLHSSIHAE